MDLFLRLFPFVFLILSLCGCRSEKQAVPFELPSNAIEEAIDEIDSQSIIQRDEELPEDWWSVFNDEQLAHFIAQAFYANPTIQTARANILMAAYNADRLKAVLFPNFNLGGDILRQKFSETGIIPFNTPQTNNPVAPPLPLPATGGVNGIPVYFTQYETEVTMSYNFDIWGKNRNTWAAALGQMWSNAADEIFTRLEIGIAVAQAYYRLQVNYQRKKIAEALVENQKKYLETVQHRMEKNVDNLISTTTAQLNLTSTEQNLTQVKNDISVDEYRLKAYIAGNFMEEIEAISIDQKELPRVPLPGDLPLHLISHRPDITAQLWLIASAGKQIEVAQAGFYPDFSITGLFGYQTIHLHRLFEWPSSFYNVDPAFTLPLFDGGKLLANLRGSEINYDLAILQYNQTVISAVQDVLTSLATLQNYEILLKDASSITKDQEEIFKLTKLRLVHNLNSQLDLLVSERNYLLSQDQKLLALGNTLQAVLSLIKALGGGYNSCDCEG